MDDSTGQSCTVVPMEPCHIEEISQLEQECFSTPWSFESLVGELSNPLAVYYVAVIDEKVVGYIGMHHVVDEGYINNIAVFEKYRNMGIGGLLLERLIEYSKENELDFITLEVRESNFHAISFYEHFGFEKVGVRKKYYSNPTEDADIMTKDF